MPEKRLQDVKTNALQKLLIWKAFSLHYVRLFIFKKLFRLKRCLAVLSLSVLVQMNALKLAY